MAVTYSRDKYVLYDNRFHFRNAPGRVRVNNDRNLDPEVVKNIRWGF
jgi:hypothetical protein